MAASNARRIITSEPPSAGEFVGVRKMIGNLYQFREIIKQFTWREVTGRYKGTYLGLIWTLITPLMTLAVYTFVFGVILNARFGVAQTGSGKLDFALNLFCGLIVFSVFSTSVSTAPCLIVGAANYVKRVVFPLETLPVSVVGAGLINAAMSMAILMPALLVFSERLSPTMYQFPLVLIPLCALSLGLSWFLASLGVFLRDLREAVGIIVQLLFFLSPVIYPLSAAPESLQPILRLNPLTTILENARRTLMWGQPIEWFWWFVVTAVSFVILQVGYVWFMKSKRAFADVI